VLRLCCSAGIPHQYFWQSAGAARMYFADSYPFIFSFLFPSVNPWVIPLALDFVDNINRACFSGWLRIFAGESGRLSVVSAFVVFPLFFLSGALFRWIISCLLAAEPGQTHPLTYAVDGVRGALLNVNAFPFISTSASSLSLP